MSTPDSPKPVDSTPQPPPPTVPTSALPAPDAPLLYPKTPAPEPPPAKPRRSRAVIVTVAVVAVLIAAGGVAFALLRPGPDPQTPPRAAASSPSARASATPTRTPRPSPSPTPAFTPYAGSLDDLLPPAPAGATVFELTVVHQEMTDAERAAALWNSNNPEWMTDLLNSTGLVRGAVRSWHDGSEGVIIVLLQFAEPDGARDWLTETIDFGMDGVNVGSPRRIPEVGTGGRSIEISSSDGTRELAGALRRGEFGVILRVGSGAPTTNLDKLHAIALQQYERLPG